MKTRNINKAQRVLLLALISMIFLIKITSAEVFLEQPVNVYNLGDELKIDASVDELLDGYFTLDMTCDNGRTILLKDILSSKIIKKSFPLSKAYIGDLMGRCTLSAYYGDSSSQTQSFTITDRVDAYLDINNKEFYPSEKVKLKLEAIKANGRPLEGFATIIFEPANISLTKIVSNGSLETGFKIPDNLASRTYSVKIDVYEKDSQEEKTNRVFLENNLIVKQEPRKVEIALDSQEAIPGKDFKFKAFVYDQVNESINTQVKYQIIDSEGKTLLEGLAQTDETVALPIALNETPGHRTVIIRIDNLETKRFFYIAEVERAEFKIINSTLKITNIGNVPYKKSVEVEISNEKEIIEVALPVGKSARYGLHAPTGVYDVRVTDGLENLKHKGVSLTGKAVKVIDADKSFAGGLLNKYPIMWVFIIGVLGLFIFGITRGLGKRKFLLKKKESPTLKDFRVDKEKQNVELIKSKSKKIEDLPIKKIISIKEAEHALVLKGQKEEASILALKIKNRSQIRKSGQCLKTIEKAIEIINEHKGAVYAIEEYVFGIFTAAISKTFKNAVPSIRAAQKIELIMKGHNRKFTDKIEFGIGLNIGDLIVKVDQATSKLKFTSLESTIPLAKKVSEIAKNQVLISEPAHRKTMSTIKTRKEADGKSDIKVYSITNILEREQHKKFIDDFLKRL